MKITVADIVKDIIKILEEPISYDLEKTSGIKSRGTEVINNILSTR